MKKIILGEIDGEEIWRYETPGEALANALTNEQDHA